MNAEVTPTTSESKTKSDAELMSGGPAGDHGKTMPKHGEVHPDLKTEIIETKETPKYEINGKTFSSAQEMSQYVADLERKVINPQPSVGQAVTVPQTQNVELIDGRPIDEVMFTDPLKYTKYIEAKVEAKIDTRNRIESERKQFWTSFYSENPDLRGKEELVDAFVAKNWGEWQKLTIPEFGKAVAQETRTKIKKMGFTHAQVLENNPAATLSSSRESVPAVRTTEIKTTSFVDELNLKRRSRKVK